MKTAVSSTKNAFPKPADVKKIAAAAALYISRWTEQELQKINKSEKMPYIWPIDNLGYVIGQFRVLNNKGTWQVRNLDNKLIHVFSEKLSAVFYALCESTSRYKLSQNLLLADSVVNKLRNDIVHYEASIKRAKSHKDYEKLDICKSRLHDASLRLQNANEELRKSVNSAKYIKYWE